MLPQTRAEEVSAARMWKLNWFLYEEDRVPFIRPLDASPLTDSVGS